MADNGELQQPINFEDGPSVNRKRKWTPEEDQRLRCAVGMCDNPSWRMISELVGTRNKGNSNFCFPTWKLFCWMYAAQCEQRWNKIIRPGIVKGPWSVEEDALLVCLVGQGFSNWGKLAKQMPGRTFKQCKERWDYHLDPSVRKSEYTKEEDELLLRLHSELGSKWSEISQSFEGRTVHSLKSRYLGLQRGNPRFQSGRKTRNALTLMDDHLSLSFTPATSSAATNNTTNNVDNIDEVVPTMN